MLFINIYNRSNLSRLIKIGRFILELLITSKINTYLEF